MSSSSSPGWFARFKYPPGSVRKVSAGAAKGLQFRVEPDMGASYGTGRDHRAAFEFLAKHVERNHIVFDIGAHAGQFTLLLAKLVGPNGKVVAVEAAPDQMIALRRNLLLNHLHHVTHTEGFPGPERGTRWYAHDVDHPAQGTFAEYAVDPGPNAVQIEVETMLLDDLTAGGMSTPHTVKIDAHGAVGEVFAGADRTLRIFRPNLFVVMHAEHHQDLEREALRAMAETYHYRVMLLDGLSLDASRVVPGPFYAWCEPE